MEIRPLESPIVHKLKNMIAKDKFLIFKFSICVALVEFILPIQYRPLFSLLFLNHPILVNHPWDKSGFGL